MSFRPLNLISLALRVSSCVIAIQCAVLIAGTLRLGGLTQRLNTHRWMPLTAFILGCTTLVTIFVGAMWLLNRGDVAIAVPGGHVGADPITAVFALLAIQTGVVGYFALQSQWRYIPLIVAVAGILLLLRPVLNLH
jgi:hypothetical protein